MQKVHLTPNEAGLIGWVTAYLVDVPDFQTDNPEHPMYVLPQLHSRADLQDAGKRLEVNFNGPGFSWIARPVDAVTSDIIRVCVEKCDYASFMAREGHESLALESVLALRSLAHKLEELKIEVNHLPGIELNRQTWSEAD